MFRTYRWLALAAAVLLAGCSAMQLTYNQADILIGWRVDSYFDLDAKQKRDFNQRLDRLLAWHRREQLPDYSRFVYTAVERARGGLKREDILWFVDGFNKRYRIIVERGAPDAADLLATLSAEQLRELSKEFAKTNRKFVEEHELDAGIERRKRARLKRMLGQISDWTGSLSHAQEEQIESMLEAIPMVEQLRHQDRLRRQREFLELLKLRGQRREFGDKLRAWLLDWNLGRAPDYERVHAEAVERRIDFYLALEKLLTPAQREHVLKRLHGFGDDFKALSERALPAGAVAADTMPSR